MTVIRYFEDYPAGAVETLGRIDVDEQEVLAFARRYDPQAFHTDPAAARDSAFGGLIASGWHTASMMMRVLVDRYLSPVSSLGSPGIDALRWLAPVRPGDVLSVRATIVEARPSRSKPDRGLVVTLFETTNQHGVLVMSMSAMNLIARRPPDDARP
jgi:acyl dehydratase